MKITAISDLHGHLESPEHVPQSEVLCICGDLCPTTIDRDFYSSLGWFMMRFIPWIESLPHEKVLLTFGNHDFFAEQLFKRENNTLKHSRDIKRKLYLPEKITFLMDGGCEINGKKFYGTPWCPHLRNWAFYGDHDTLVDKFSQIPGKLDVLMTHCAPRVFDYGTSHYPGGGIQEFGCTELTEAIAQKHPKLCLFGHIHSGSHVEGNWCPREAEGEVVRLCNVSIMDESYDPTYRIKTFDI